MCYLLFQQLQYSATYTMKKSTLQSVSQVWTDTVDLELTTQSNLGETAGTEIPTTESTIISTEPTTTEVQTTENIQPLSGLTRKRTSTIPTTTTSAQPVTTTTPWSCRYKCPPHDCEVDVITITLHQAPKIKNYINCVNLQTY